MMALAHWVPPLFLIGFVNSAMQYWYVNAPQRIWESRFGMAVAAVVAMITYVGLRITHPDWRIVPAVFVALGIVHVAVSVYMLRRMPKPGIPVVRNERR